MIGRVASKFLRVSKPISYWDVVCHHLPMVLVAGIPLILALTATRALLPLKPCTFKALTGFPCPFCGFTRSFQAMVSGDWSFVFYNCPLACVVFVACILVILWNAAGLLFGIKIQGFGKTLASSFPAPRITLMACLIFGLNWGYRLMEGLK